MEDKTKAFKNHFGVHYSTSAILFYYLIRLGPITENSIKFQNMRFDHPNRIFTSISDTWDILERLYDNRELIPEIFSMPEIFLNNNCYYMGKNSTTFKIVDDIFLPEYAKKNPINFTYIHRYFLEDKCVSDSLSSWIDNIFGENQLKKNKESLNVFKKCCYAQETNLVEKYEFLKKSMSQKNQNTENKEAESKILKKVDKILNFGQVPAKLFEYKHPKKNTLLKQNDYEALFPDLYINFRNMKKPIRYFNKSKSFIYVLYFDNEVEVLKSTKLEKSYKFQLKAPAYLMGYNYNYSYVKKKLKEETEKYKNDIESNEIEISKKEHYIKEELTKKLYNYSKDKIQYPLYRRELDIKKKEIEILLQKKIKFDDPKYLAKNYNSFYHYYFIMDKEESINKESKTNKISQRISEDILSHYKIAEINNLKNLHSEFEKIFNDKIWIPIYNEKFFINEFSDCKFFVACQYLDNSIKIYKEETKFIEFILEDVIK